ncbi:MAG TPA: c-type cytochrome [Vicinamibacterales bacterium]|nr:c-type cytochrome [Vicinamibacterales bacterium]
MIRRIPGTRTLGRIAVLLCAVAALQFIVRDLNAQAALAVPAGLPDWAFNVPDKIQPTAVRPEGTVKAPGSAHEYDAAAIAGNATPPDWFPDEHPAAPRSVKGGTGITMACGSCHLMSGQGHPESADLAGLPAEYLIRQMAYYKAGTRKDEARMGPIARAASDDDVRQAAEYFAALKPIVWVKVIETATPPRTFIATAGRHRQLHPDGGTEPIGHRILEIPADPFRTEIRDPHSGFIAYVPPGSVARGEALVNGAPSAKTVRCAICHGEGLKGLGEVPRLAGLQPLYVARQLFDMRYGSSAGKAAALMKRVVANLTDDDIIAIAAYVASLPPQ